MTEKSVKPHIIVITDLALGDDYGAALAMCAYAAINNSALSFVGTYGDRSDREAANNLALVVPRLWKQLGQARNSLPGIYIGADRPTNSDHIYKIPRDSIERKIHGEFSKKPGEELVEIKQSKNLIQALIKSNIPVALLSIGAPTEAAKLTKSLSSLIYHSVAMLSSIFVQGNVDPNIEANALRDPTANEDLLKFSEDFKIPLTLVPLSCTENRSVLFKKKDLDELEKSLGKGSFVFNELLSIAGKNSTYGGFYSRSRYISTHFPYKTLKYTGVPLHDLTAAMALIDRITPEMRLMEYARNILVKAEPSGSIGLARNYNLPNHRVNIAGPITENFWPEITKLLKRYY
jgi:inosine-uridine nucleoside N-ribohydrolase